jgi:cruciform cutting endonuclease 1
MALQLPALKLSQLKTLAFKCGISSSGTKPILTRRLVDEITLAPLKQNASPMRILSIDMGIRNLAYCVLDLPISKSKSKKELPSIHAWRRLAVSTAPEKPVDDGLELAETPATKEAFDPFTLSTIAYNLLRHRLLPENPTHILIERQRFRSMGSKHILEWTIRVNMFESILYGVLCTLKGEGVWNGTVIGIAPGKVGPFWVGELEGEEAGGKERKSKNSKIRNKGLKVDLVRKWLEGGEMVQFGNESIEDMARAYKEKWERIPGRRKIGVLGVEVGDGEKMGKLDDLADCLLQGMAWVQWEGNKRLLLKRGVEALLEP